jgi:hypothetical protein
MDLGDARATRNVARMLGQDDSPPRAVRSYEFRRFC